MAKVTNNLPIAVIVVERGITAKTTLQPGEELDTQPGTEIISLDPVS